MRKPSHIILLLTMLLCLSCQQNDITVIGQEDEMPEQNQCVPGKAVIKVSEELWNALESGERDVELMPGASIRRTFAHGGRYEDRMRRAGLHLWLDVEFDEAIPLTKAGGSLLDVEGVELVEFMPVTSRSDVSYPFDDPNLKKQWHYWNKGNVLTGLEAGCDVNVFPAWERGVVGSGNVVVAVIDGGVDFNHEDLAGNMWEGKDTLGNTIHGYNFVTDSYTINPESHGTHVAGTIAAVSNNGTGVSGIAGGNAAEGIKGASIMSCQIFDGEDGGNGAAAIVWAANNGAVIAQNSWGYPHEENPDLTDTPEYMKAAIDYFNSSAGCDEEGNQLPDSPMKGGVVFFSAGNESRSMGYPASYQECIAVSGIAGDYTLAYYSNFGDWVDISAPGGDAYKSQYVYSTVVNDSYDSYQGTSMACPHVSGVAALILSEFGGPGFTREDLIDRLLTTASDISLPADEMGAGMVDASAAVAHYGDVAPNLPTYDSKEEPSGNSLLLKYIVPEGNEGVQCESVDLYYSDAPFSTVSEEQNLLSQSTKTMHTGDTLYFTVENLSFSTSYYFSVMSYDVYGNPSKLSDNVVITTQDNLAPVINAIDGVEHSLKKYMTSKFRFEVNDPENELEEVAYQSATEYDSLVQEGDQYVLTIEARNIEDGSYTSKITASDRYGKTSECEISFTVEANSAPTVVLPFEHIVITSKSKSRTIVLADHISDKDGEPLSYTVTSSDESVVTASVEKDNVVLKSVSYGKALITVVATDALKDMIETVFLVVVRDGSRPVDIYPNPVTDGKLYVRSTEKEEMDMQIVSASGSVVFSGKVVADPFEPAEADLSSVLPGIYNVRVTNKSGKVTTQNIVKL